MYKWKALSDFTDLPACGVVHDVGYNVVVTIYKSKGEKQIRLLNAKLKKKVPVQTTNRDTVAQW